MYKISYQGREYPGAAELIFTGPLSRPPEAVKLELDTTLLPGAAIGDIEASFREAVSEDLHPDPERGGRSPERHQMTTRQHASPGTHVTRLALRTQRTRDAITADLIAKLGEKDIHVSRQPVIATLRFSDAESRPGLNPSGPRR